MYLKEIGEGQELCHNLFIYKSYGFTTIKDIEVIIFLSNKL